MNIREFILPHLERVIDGAGAVERLPPELDRAGCTRAVVVTGRTLGASPLGSRVTALLGHRCVTVFDGVRQHVPASSVAALLAVVRDSRADCLVSLGGGSAIDAAKGAVHARLLEGGGDTLVHVAVPTTLSAGEFTNVAGMTDDATRVKRAVYDVRLAPRTVIADPDVTRETPAWLWAASGIRALDHAIETLYSSRSHPLSEPLATRAIEMLAEHLPASTRTNGPNDPNNSRASCQMAAWLAVFGMTNAGFGLSHVLGHQIGPRWDVAHGLTSAIMLPHAMAVMADAVPGRFAPIARGFGIAFDPAAPRAGARACVDRTRAFIATFHLPGRLRDVSVREGEMGTIAEHVCDVLRDADLIGRPITREDVMGLLEAAY